MGSLRVHGVLAAAPGGRPSLVVEGLDSWAEEQRKADEIERDEIAKLLPTAEDPAFRAFYESELERLDAAIADVSPDSEVVFAVVVEGDAGDLRSVAAQDGVRLVDVGEAGESPAAADDLAYRGLRPEETVRTGEPATRPVGEEG